MDSYQVEKEKTQAIQLPDEDAEIDPVPTEGSGDQARSAARILLS